MPTAKPGAGTRAPEGRTTVRRKVLALRNAARCARLALALLCIAVGAAAAGCWTAGCGLVVGSGTLVTERPRVHAFTRVEVDGAFRVRVLRSSVYGVRLTLDENVAEYVELVVEDDTLHLGLEDGHHYVNAVLEAEVTLAKMSTLDLDGACRVELQGFNSLVPLQVDLDGDSRLRAIDLRSTELALDIRGSSVVDGTWVMTDGRFVAGGKSVVRLAGAVDRLTLSLSGRSSGELDHFRTESLDAELSGGSYAVVHVTGNVNAELHRASVLEYVGSPELGRIVTSGGSMVCRTEE